MPTLFSVDAHAAGEPCRVVTGGLPTLRGRTVGERRRDFRERFDWVRRSLMLEPRGHAGMFGAMLLPPEREESAYGLLFFDTGGYLDGCGHGTMCSVAVWRRLVGESEVPFWIDNPDGSRTRVVALEGDAGFCRVTLAMPPTTVIESYLEVPGFEHVSTGLARCGNVYLVVDAADLGVDDVSSLGADEIVELGGAIREAAVPIVGEREELPGGDVSGWLEVALYRARSGPPAGEPAGESVSGPGGAAEDGASAGVEVDTAILFSRTQVDRSPCGTGSCALAGLLYDRGELAPGTPVRTFGPAGRAFELASRPASGEDGSSAGRYGFLLTGEAAITGIHEWVIGDEDPLATGFRLA